jgi:hypothetical protein
MGTAPAFASVSEALDMVQAGLSYLAAADAAQLPAGDPGRVPAPAGAQRCDRHCGAGVHPWPGSPPGQGLPPTTPDYSAVAWLIHHDPDPPAGPPSGNIARPRPASTPIARVLTALAAGLRAWAHISLADLLLLDNDSALQEEWTAQVRARWAANRAFAAETGSEGGAWSGRAGRRGDRL